MSSPSSANFPDFPDFGFNSPLVFPPALSINDEQNPFDANFDDLFHFGTFDVGQPYGARGFLESSLSAPDTLWDVQALTGQDPTPADLSAHFTLQPQIQIESQPQPQSQNEKNKDANANTTILPARNINLQLHTPPSDESYLAPLASSESSLCSSSVSETLLPAFPFRRVALDANENPDPLFLADPPVPQVPADSQAGPSHTRDARSGRASSRAAPAKKADEEEDIWHVTLLPDSATTLPSGNAAASGSTGSSTRLGRRRRKDVFMRVERPQANERPEWYTPKPPAYIPARFPIKHKHKKRGEHSEMGWVLARIREPNCQRARYGWAIAELFNPMRDMYLVLSGPHATSIKTVRIYDRVAYSPDAIAQLKEANARKGKQHRVEIYDRITRDISQLAHLGFGYSTTAATAGLEALGSVSI